MSVCDCWEERFAVCRRVLRYGSMLGSSGPCCDNAGVFGGDFGKIFVAEKHCGATAEMFRSSVKIAAGICSDGDGD